MRVTWWHKVILFILTQGFELTVQSKGKQVGQEPKASHPGLLLSKVCFLAGSVKWNDTLHVCELISMYMYVLIITPIVSFQVRWRSRGLWLRNKWHNVWILQAEDVKDIQLSSKVTALSPFKRQNICHLVIRAIFYDSCTMDQRSLPPFSQWILYERVCIFEWHCLWQMMKDGRRHRETFSANEIVWPTSFSAIHFSKDTERAFMQVNHDWSLKWKRVVSEGRVASIIYYTRVARHLGGNAVFQAYKTEPFWCWWGYCCVFGTCLFPSILTDEKEYVSRRFRSMGGDIKSE